MDSVAIVLGVNGNCCMIANIRAEQNPTNTHRRYIKSLINNGLPV